MFVLVHLRQDRHDADDFGRGVGRALLPFDDQLWKNASIIGRAFAPPIQNIVRAVKVANGKMIFVLLVASGDIGPTGKAIVGGVTGGSADIAGGIGDDVEGIRLDAHIVISGILAITASHAAAIGVVGETKIIGIVIGSVVRIASDAHDGGSPGVVALGGVFVAAACGIANTPNFMMSYITCHFFDETPLHFHIVIGSAPLADGNGHAITVVGESAIAAVEIVGAAGGVVIILLRLWVGG